MLKFTTAIAAGMIALAATAHADTVKQIWNQPLGEDNPGRITSADNCLNDDYSAFGCWHDSDLGEESALGGAEETPDDPTEPNGNGATTDTLIEL